MPLVAHLECVVLLERALLELWLQIRNVGRCDQYHCSGDFRCFDILDGRLGLGTVRPADYDTLQVDDHDQRLER